MSILGLCITHSTKTSGCISFPINFIPAHHINPGGWGLESRNGNGYEW